MEKENDVIQRKRESPFGKAVRIQNFKMWRTNVSVGSKQTIQAICISNLDGTWKVQIPQTYLMFRALTDLYGTEDKQDFDILFSFLTNFNFATSISNGHFQNFLILAVYGYMHPEVLEKGFKPADKKFLSYKDFMQRIKTGIESYKEFARNSKPEDMTDEEYRQAETAAEMQDKLDELEKTN